jgi:hypothetical protein
MRPMALASLVAARSTQSSRSVPSAAVTRTVAASKRSPSGASAVTVTPGPVEGAAPAPPDEHAAPSSTSTSARTVEHRVGTTGHGSVAAMGDTCDSCGRSGETLYAVHRKYVTPESWDTPAAERTLA